MESLVDILLYLIQIVLILNGVEVIQTWDFNFTLDVRILEIQGDHDQAKFLFVIWSTYLILLVFVSSYLFNIPIFRFLRIGVWIYSSWIFPTYLRVTMTRQNFIGVFWLPTFPLVLVYYLIINVLIITTVLIGLFLGKFFQIPFILIPSFQSMR